MLAEINTMVVCCYFDAFNERELDTCLTTHSPDWVGRFRPGSHVSLRGRDVNVARMQSLIDQLPDVQIRIENLRIVGDLVVVRFTVSGHGGETDPPGFAVLRLERGRIIDEYVVNPLLGRHARDFAEGLDADFEVA